MELAYVTNLIGCYHSRRGASVAYYQPDWLLYSGGENEVELAYMTNLVDVFNSRMRKEADLSLYFNLSGCFNLAGGKRWGLRCIARMREEMERALYGSYGGK